MVEMMFAIMICSIVLLGLLGVLTSVLRNQAEGRTYERISVAASTIFGRAGEALAENWSRPLVPDVFEAGRQPVPNLEELAFEVEETAEKDDLKRVDVTLYWTDEGGGARQKTMTTKFLKGNS